MKEENAAASCQQCDWTAAPGSEPEVNEEAVTHMRDTGHVHLTVNYNGVNYPPGRKV